MQNMTCIAYSHARKIVEKGAGNKISHEPKLAKANFPVHSYLPKL